MILLLDTHTFLWSACSPRKLSKAAQKVLERADNDIFVSVVSFWEVSLKFALGKLDLDGVAPDDLPGVARQMGFEVLELGSGDAASFHLLPTVGHKDPFDRMLVHQCIRQRMPLVSCDEGLDVYGPHGFKRIW